MFELWLPLIKVFELDSDLLRFKEWSHYSTALSNVNISTISTHTQLFSINKMLHIATVLTRNKSQFKWYLFVCSMLQSSYLLVAPRLAQPTVYLQSVGQVKRFIEWLSQYIAPGRLALKPPWYLPHRCVSWMTFVTPRGVSFPSNPFNFSSIALTSSCIFFFFSFS